MLCPLLQFMLDLVFIILYLIISYWFNFEAVHNLDKEQPENIKKANVFLTSAEFFLFQYLVKRRLQN